MLNPSSSSITTVVCNNGLGHFRRATMVLAHLCARLENVEITMFCEQWQIDLARDWKHMDMLNERGISFITGCMDPGVRWLRSSADYDDGCLSEWVDRISGYPELYDADLVLSDNLASVLTLRPDAILLGSFLWSDVLESAYPESNSVCAFAEYERRLLSRDRPTMICVGAIAMPAVHTYTNAVEVGFMCNPRSQQNRSIGRREYIALLGGATDTIQSEMVQLVEELVITLPGRILVDSRIVRDLSPKARGRVSLFDYEPASYESCSVVVCRPGIGTVTDCVAAGTPMILVYEERNSEMSHNARRLSQLGVAIDMEAGVSSTGVVASIEFLLGEKSFQDKFSLLNTNGVSETVDWLVRNYVPT